MRANEPQTGKIKGTYRPEKASFQVFMGIFFLLVCLPCTYYGYWSFKEHRRHNDSAQYFRQRPDMTIKSSTPERMAVLEKSLANRDLLGARVSGAGSLVFLGVALWLFSLAIKTSSIKPEFATINWQTIPKPIGQLTIEYTSVANCLFIFLVIFLGGLSLLLLITNGPKIISMAIAGSNLSILFVIYLFQLRAKRHALCRLDESGVTRGDGRHFDWDSFRGVINHIGINPRTGVRYVWRTELVFADGETA